MTHRFVASGHSVARSRLVFTFLTSSNSMPKLEADCCSSVYRIFKNTCIPSWWRLDQCSFVCMVNCSLHNIHYFSVPFFPPYVHTEQCACWWTKLPAGLPQPRNTSVSCVLWHNLSFRLSLFPLVLFVLMLKWNLTILKGEGKGVLLIVKTKIILESQQSRFESSALSHRQLVQEGLPQSPRKKTSQPGWYRNKSLMTCMFPFCW